MRAILILALATITPLMFFEGKVNGYEAGREDGHVVGFTEGRASAQQDQRVATDAAMAMGLCNYAQHICKVPHVSH
jgi:hypothetical protein